MWLRCCTRQFSELHWPALSCSCCGCRPQLHGDGLDWRCSGAPCRSILCCCPGGACCTCRLCSTHGCGSCCHCGGALPCRQQQCLLLFLQLSSQVQICMRELCVECSAVLSPLWPACAYATPPGTKTRECFPIVIATHSTAQHSRPHLGLPPPRRSSPPRQPPQRAPAAPQAQAGWVPRAAATPPARPL